MMKINIHSITFKTLFNLIVFSTIFVAFIAISSQHIFSSAYINLEKDKIEIIENSINPSLALNISYGFTKAIDEITDKALKNPNILLLKIQTKELNEEFIYTKHKHKIEEYKKNKEFISTSDLVDPATFNIIGKITLVYSKKSYEEYMEQFYKLFVIAIFVFFLSLIILSYLLYKSLNKLSILANKLNDFNPHNPARITDIKVKKDEIASILTSANFMIDNIIKFINYSKELNLINAQHQTHLKDAQRIAHVGSWEYDVTENSLTLSDEIYRTFGIKKDININWNKFISFISKEHIEYINSIFDNAIKNGSNFDVKYVININSKHIDIHTVGKVRKKVDGTIKITAVSMDITEDAKNKKIIEQLAYYDSLTKLPNRALLKDRIHKALQNAQRVNTKIAIIFLDLDHFKLINDTLGHSMGDKLLIYVSKLLKEQVRESDTVARLGGDEFIILLPNIDSIEDVENICKKILEVFKVQHTIDAHQLYITTSIGISIYPDNSTDMDQLITNADTAMYDAKQDGRNKYKLYSKNMGNYISSQMSIEQDLKEAINTEVGLEVFYQAKINATNNFISGAEALIRWNHPTKGLIFPDEFIQVAESTGMILDMGNWIIEQCCMQLREWNKIGFGGLKIAINLSPRQFQDNNLASFIFSMIQKYDINSSQLEFEITETMSMSNMDATLRVLHELKDIGVSIAIDDFGTGYSSLSYLKQFPVNTLKIDKSFVMDMIDDEEDKIIVQTIISMAHSLGFNTVAEGVESKKHMELLKNMDCDELQGYHYTKAIPKDDFTKFMQNYLPNISSSL